MGIKVTDVGTIISTGDGIRVYDVLSMRAALRLEIRTGMVMRHGFSIVKACIDRGYVSEGTRDKRKAYVQLDALAVSLGAQARPLAVKGGTK